MSGCAVLLRLRSLTRTPNASCSGMLPGGLPDRAAVRPALGKLLCGHVRRLLRNAASDDRGRAGEHRRGLGLRRGQVRVKGELQLGLHDQPRPLVHLLMLPEPLCKLYWDNFVSNSFNLLFQSLLFRMQPVVRNGKNGQTPKPQFTRFTHVIFGTAKHP